MTIDELYQDEIAVEDRAWRAVWIGHAALVSQLEVELQKAHAICMDDHLILMLLVEAQDQRLRMSELATLSVMPKSRLTYRVDHLVSRGLVLREPCIDDKRGSFACVTDQGVETYRRACVTHLQGVRRHLFEHASDDDALAVGRVFQRVLAAAFEGGSPVASNRR